MTDLWVSLAWATVSLVGTIVSFGLAQERVPFGRPLLILNGMALGMNLALAAIAAG